MNRIRPLFRTIAPSAAAAGVAIASPQRNMQDGDLFNYVGQTVNDTELAKLRQRAAGMGFDVEGTQDGGGWRVTCIYSAGCVPRQGKRGSYAVKPNELNGRLEVYRGKATQ